MEAIEARIAALEEALRTSENLRAQAEASLTQAKQTADEALKQAQSATLGRENRNGGFGVDTRSLGKPEIFKGLEKDWKDFSIIFRAYAGAVNKQILIEMTNAELEAEGDKLLNAKNQAETVQRSNELYYMLVLICREKALSKVTSVAEGEGYASWRALIDEYEPKLSRRFAGLLVHILGYRFDVNDLTTSLEKWERLIKDYESQSDEKVTDNMRVGILTANMPDEDIAKHIFMNASKYTSYKILKSDVTDMVKIRQIKDGPAPMAIDGVFKKGDGGKGKGGKGGKGACWTCGKTGHSQKDCWQNKGTKGGGKGAGKGNKGGGKGDYGGKGGKGAKGDARQRNMTCWNCGKTGHNQSQCWSKGNGKGHKGGAKGISQVEPEAEKEIGGVDLNSIEINAVEPPGTPQIIRIGVDSCAGTTVFPVDFAKNYPLKETEKSRNGTSYKAANGQLIWNQGERRVNIDIPGAGCRRIKGQVTHVHKPLLAVSEMVDADHDVMFSKRYGCYAYHYPTGKTTWLTRRNGSFEIEGRLLPCSEASNGGGIETVEKKILEEQNHKHCSHQHP